MAAELCKPKCNGKEFAFVRWMEDETVDIMWLSAVAKGYDPFVGATVKMRWRGKREYEAEILKISCKTIYSNIIYT